MGGKEVYVVYSGGVIISKLLGEGYPYPIFLDKKSVEDFIDKLPKEYDREDIVIIPFVVPDKFDEGDSEDTEDTGYVDEFTVSKEDFKRAHLSQFAKKSSKEMLVFDLNDIRKFCTEDEIDTLSEINSKILSLRGLEGKNPKPVYSVLEISSSGVLM